MLFRSSHPALTDLQVDWSQMNVSDVYPKTIPDLYSGRPIFLTGRFKGRAPSSVTVRAQTPDGEVQIVTPILREIEAQPELASIWARAKIADLSLDARRAGNSKLQKQIKQTALDYNLMSQFTAFVAVDSSRRTAGRDGTTVPVTVPVPQGVKYSTTVPEN